MQFGRIGEAGSEIPIVVHEGQAYDLRPVTADIDGAFLASDPVGTVRTRLRDLEPIDIDDIRRAAPISRPAAVYCIGMNYAAHAREGGHEPPERIVMFMKPPHTVVGPDDDFPLPTGAEKVDWESELAIVIGSTAWRVQPEAARAHIAGYTVANDLSERAWQLELSGGQWSKGKGGPGFCPLGPWLITADSVDPSDLRVRSFVNGEPRQDSRTSDLIFGIEQIVADLSQFTVLEPGDLILTGTPEGVALSGRFRYLSVGDVMEIEVEHLGRQRQLVVAEASA
ncbi:MAG: fumarylacetoacetate hydrolase family protein [Beutenbergiaceae bacterium]